MDPYSNKVFQQGLIALKKGYVGEATKYFSALYATYPFDATVVIYYGYCFVLAKDYRKAIRMWEKLDKLTSDKKLSYLLLAYGYAKNGNVDYAVDFWLEILKIDPNNKKAKDMLDFLKKSKSNSYFSKRINFKQAVGILPYWNTRSFHILFSKISMNIKKIVIIISIILILFFIGFAVISYYFSTDNFFNLSKKPIDKINTSYLPLDKQNDTYIFYNSDEEIEKDFNLLKKYIERGMYNQSVYIINKINISNAKMLTKEKARRFENFLHEPQYSQEISNPTFDELARAPELYLNYFVKWKGIVNELDKKKGSFNLLIYEKSDIYIKGMVHCFLDEPDFLFNNIHVEIFAKFIQYDENGLYFEIKFVKILD